MAKDESFDWKCGKCGMRYTSDEFIKLNHIKAVESDTDPKSQHGFTAVCTCGYRFHKDKWYLKDILAIKHPSLGEVEVEVSTVDLELNHFGNWYESMIFVQNADFSVECGYQTRYETKAQAEKGHDDIIRALQTGKWKITVKTYQLDVEV